jgi:hypothetical protein
MGQFSISEDLFAVIAVISLTSLLVAAFAHYYHEYAERKSIQDCLDLALDIAERLRNDLLAKRNGNVLPGLIDPNAFEGLQSRLQLFAGGGGKLYIEVRTLEGKLILSYGSEPNPLSRYFSPPCSVSLPIAIAQTPASRPLGELIVRIWR